MTLEQKLREQCAASGPCSDVHDGCGCSDVELFRAALSSAEGKLEKAKTALEWYSEKVAGCRKVTSEGNDARYALDKDGGKLAAATLKDLTAP